MIQIEPLSYRSYLVIEENEDTYDEYYVFFDIAITELGDTSSLITKAICTCPYYTRKPGRICKHIKEVIKWIVQQKIKNVLSVS